MYRFDTRAASLGAAYAPKAYKFHVKDLNPQFAFQDTQLRKVDSRAVYTYHL